MNSKRKGTLIILASVLAAASAIDVAAHEGHDHRVLGTVAAVRATQLDVKTQDGKLLTFIVGADTRILRDKTAIKLADIGVGTRVVVTALQGKEPPIAKEIRVGTSTQTSR
jgi:hypothetical protein